MTRLNHSIRLTVLFGGFLLWNAWAQAEHYTLPLFVTSTSTDAATGVVRILNATDESGAVEIYAIDDAGTRFGPTTFTLDASAAAEFSASDLASGNAAKGLTGGVGSLSGYVRLEIDTDLQIVPAAYVRAADGTLSTMHDTVRADAASAGGHEYLVPIFNPSTETTQASSLRLINPGDAAAIVTIEGRDDHGTAATGGTVQLTLAAGAAQTLTAQQLEAGDASLANLTGQLGAGVGKWRLSVSSDQPIQVVNVVSSTSGPMNNLSTTAVAGLAPQDHDAFNERFVDRGIENQTDSGDFAFAAEAGDTFTETGEVDGVAVSYAGSYAYEAIGADAGRVTVSYDDGDECEANLYFASRTDGWFASLCTGTDNPVGYWVAGNWSIVDEEDDGNGDGTSEPGSLGACQVGMFLGIGQSCTYPGTTDAFSVNVRGRGSFLDRLFGIRIRINNETINGRVYDFEASHQGDGVWRIDRIAGNTEPTTGGTGDARTITVDFHRGVQGFVAGFADLPDTGNETYELMSGFEPLPPPLAPEMALFISGANRSGDLFMFFRGQIGGLVPGVRYNATVSMEIATDTPSGCFGIGGAPGESVYIKAGVSEVEPLPVLEGSYLRMNIDIGNQSNGGEQAAVLGDVANSRPCEQSPQWELKSFPAQSVPAPVTASPDGRVWLLFGTDSGFEGRTQIYFTRVSVTFTPV